MQDHPKAQAHLKAHERTRGPPLGAAQGSRAPPLEPNEVLLWARGPPKCLGPQGLYEDKFSAKAWAQALPNALAMDFILRKFQPLK